MKWSKNPRKPKIKKYLNKYKKEIFKKSLFIIMDAGAINFKKFF